MARHPQILSTGSYVPERVVTNAEVDALMGASTDQWLVENVGIRERRWMSAEQTTSDLIVEAAKKALVRAGLSVGDLDLIIVSTDTPDYLSPSTSVVVQSKLGAGSKHSIRLVGALCDKIIELDRNIRFVGIVNSRGEVIECGFQQGVEPLLNETEEQQMYIQSLCNLTTLESYSDRLGRVRYSITEHEKVILLTVPLRDGILCISASSRVDPIKLRDKVLKALRSGSKPARAARNSKAKS